MTIERKYEWPLFILAFGLLLFVLAPHHKNTYQLNGDEERYIAYAVSIYEHNIFGLTKTNNEKPLSGFANAPLAPLLIAGFMTLDDQFAASLKCIAKSKTPADCPRHFEGFFTAQLALSLICLFIIYLTAWQFSRKKTTAWIAAFMALASGIFMEFSHSFMTEIFILPFFTALLLVCLKLYQKRALNWSFAAGILLGILTLIRPSYLYLFYGFILFFTLWLAVQNNRYIFYAILVLVLGFITITAPWAIRNKIQFDTFALSGGGYAEAILIQRTNYNQMSWQEAGVAMIYWLPDFGDSLAEKLFKPPLYNKLGWSEGSYYAQQYEEQEKQLTEKLGSEDKILGHLLQKEILTLKHMVVSIPLALRGAFIAKYWGLFGFIASAALLLRTIHQRDYSLLAMILPLFFMVAFHAGLSVSIPRYNLPLVTLYALSLAWYINLYGTNIVKKFSAPS